jgi:hypothetical protein
MEIPNETSKDLVLVMNSIVTTGGHGWNSRRSRGQKLDTHTYTHARAHTHTHTHAHAHPHTHTHATPPHTHTCHTPTNTHTHARARALAKKKMCFSFSCWGVVKLGLEPNQCSATKPTSPPMLPDRLWSLYPASCSFGTGGSSPRVNAAGSWTWSLTPTNAELKWMNEWSCKFTPSYAIVSCSGPASRKAVQYFNLC